MRLTLGTDYALRALIHVGTKGEHLAEIVRSFGVSKTHLMKVVNELAQQGYVDSVRGKGSGIRLGRRPERINLGAIVRETEDDLAVMGCLSEKGFCRIEGCCVLRRAPRETTDAFLRSLDGYRLADLLAPHAKLARSLGLLPEDRSAAWNAIRLSVAAARAPRPRPRRGRHRPSRPA